MARAKYILWSGLTAISAFVCIATMVIWARSYTHITIASINSPVGGIGFNTAAGLASFYIQVPPLEPQAKAIEMTESAEQPQSIKYYAQLLQPTDGFGDFHAWIASYPSTGRALCATAPLWSIALTSAILPATFAIRYMRLRRKNLAAGRCAACGYDLRATLYRCPECGSVPKRPNAV